MWAEGVSERYAEALYSLAAEQGKVVEIGRELVLAANLVAAQPALAHALRAPDVPEPVKKNIVRQVLGPGMSALTLNFFYLLVDRRRVDMVGSMAREFREMAEQAQGRVDVDVTVAVDLPQPVRQSVETRLSGITGRQATLQWHVDPQILGGIVVRIKDTLIDYSLKTQLHEMRERLVHAHA